MEFIKDYNLVITYHPKNKNTMADALRWKLMRALVAMFSRLEVVEDAIVVELAVRATLVPRILETQLFDDKVTKWVNKTEEEKAREFTKRKDGGLYFS